MGELLLVQVAVGLVILRGLRGAELVQREYLVVSGCGIGVGECCFCRAEGRELGDGRPSFFSCDTSFSLTEEGRLVSAGLGSLLRAPSSLSGAAHLNLA